MTGQRIIEAVEELQMAQARLMCRRHACGPSQSVRDVLRLVERATARNEPITPKELSEQTGISPAGVTRVLKTLTESGSSLLRLWRRTVAARQLCGVWEVAPDFALDHAADAIRSIVGNLDRSSVEVIAELLEQVRDMIDAECR